MEENKLKHVTFEKSLNEFNFPENERKCEFELRKDPCSSLITEQKAQYGVPNKNRKIVTRESRLEQFWWHEFYEDYLRKVKSRINPHPMPNSEYKDNYSKEMTSSSSEELINKFPLYGSNSISFYNQDGNKDCNFRRNYAITKPVYLQDEQFG